MTLIVDERSIRAFCDSCNTNVLFEQRPAKMMDRIDSVLNSLRESGWATDTPMIICPRCLEKK